MPRRSEIALVGLVGAVAVCVLLLSRSRTLDSADNSPIVAVTPQSPARLETDDPLVRPERTPVVPESLPSDSSQAPTLRPEPGLQRAATPVRAQAAHQADGFVRTFHENGAVESEGRYRGGAKDGEWIYFSETGSKELSGTYLNGKAEGTWTAWHDNGRVRSVGACRAGQFDGLCSFWTVDGVLDAERSGIYEQGQLTTRR